MYFSQMRAPSLLVAQTKLLGVRESRVSMEQEILLAQRKARIPQMGEGAQSEWLRNRNVVVVSLERHARNDRGSTFDNP